MHTSSLPCNSLPRHPPGAVRARHEIQIELDLRPARRARTVRGEKKAAAVATAKQPARRPGGAPLRASATSWLRPHGPRTATLPAGTGPSRIVPPARTRRIRRDIAALPMPVPTASRVSASGSNTGRGACSTPCRSWCRQPNRCLLYTSLAPRPPRHPDHRSHRRHLPALQPHQPRQDEIDPRSSQGPGIPLQGCLLYTSRCV